MSAGQADYWRGTGDFNLPLSDTAAARLTVMDQRNGVVQRDQVLYRRYGVAPTLALGIGTPTRLTLSYFKEEENNLPDYGIPFIDGAPADVESQQLLRAGQLRSHAHQHQYRHHPVRA